MMQILSNQYSVNQYSKIVLNLSESETPVCLEDDGEVSWSGFSTKMDQFSYADEEAEIMMAQINLVPRASCLFWKYGSILSEFLWREEALRMRLGSDTNASI